MTRTCRAETYRIKSTVYHALSSFCDSLTTSSTTTEANRVFELLTLFDHILTAECPPASTPIAMLQTSTDDITCDFCGADIFQSFFECRHCTLSGEPSLCGNGLALCPACFSDGRHCLCPMMGPMQVRNFGSLLDERRKAVSTLKTYTEVNGLQEFNVLPEE